MICKYSNGNCLFAKTMSVNIGTSGDWCFDCCGPTVSDKLKMLKRFGVELPAPPPDTDLLEWAEKCIADGAAKIAPQIEKQRKQKAKRGKEQAEFIELAKEMELPSPVQQAKNLGRHLKEIWAYRKKTGRKYVSDEWRDQRLAICRACPKLIIKNGKEFCSLCGCGVAKGVFVWESKTQYEAMTCELGYWAEVDRANGKV